MLERRSLAHLWIVFALSTAATVMMISGVKNFKNVVLIATTSSSLGVVTYVLTKKSS